MKSNLKTLLFILIILTSFSIIIYFGEKNQPQESKSQLEKPSPAQIEYFYTSPSYENFISAITTLANKHPDDDFNDLSLNLKILITFSTMVLDKYAFFGKGVHQYFSTYPKNIQRILVLALNQNNLTDIVNSLIDWHNIEPPKKLYLTPDYIKAATITPEVPESQLIALAAYYATGDNTYLVKQLEYIANLNDFDFIQSFKCSTIKLRCDLQNRSMTEADLTEIAEAVRKQYPSSYKKAFEATLFNGEVIAKLIAGSKCDSPALGGINYYMTNDPKLNFYKRFEASEQLVALK